MNSNRVIKSLSLVMLALTAAPALAQGDWVVCKTEYANPEMATLRSSIFGRTALLGPQRNEVELFILAGSDRASAQIFEPQVIRCEDEQGKLVCDSHPGGRDIGIQLEFSTRGAKVFVSGETRSFGGGARIFQDQECAKVAQRPAELPERFVPRRGGAR